MHITKKVNDGYIGSGRLLRKAIKKYGKYNFKREIICYYTSVEEAHKNEELLIKIHNTLTPNGYNISPTGGIGAGGGAHAEQSKLKVSIANKGRSWSKEEMEVIKLKASITREHNLLTRRKYICRKNTPNISLIKVMKKLRKELSKTNKKIIQKYNKKTVKRKRKYSREQIERLAKYNTGRKMSEETKQKMRISAIKRGISPEQRLKMQDHPHKKGIIPNEETRRKMSLAKKGKKFTPEHCAKIQETKRKIREDKLKKIPLNSSLPCVTE